MRGEINIMEKLKLSEKLELSRIVQGLWRLSDWKFSDEELLTFIKEAIALGVTSFDHADIYGSYTCEELFGKALVLDKSLRSKIQIITKTGIKLPSKNRPNHHIHCYDTSYNHIISSVERSLQNFGTDYLDLVLIHRPDMFMDADETARALIELRNSGKVLEFGVSNFTPSDFSLLQSRLNFALVTNQIEVSPLQNKHFYDGTINYMQEKRIPIMVWSPLAGGKIFTSEEKNAVELRRLLEELEIKYKASQDTIIYAWLLAHPSKMIPISGSGKMERLKTAVEACNIKLTREDWFKIFVAGQGFDIP